LESIRRQLTHLSRKQTSHPPTLTPQTHTQKKRKSELVMCSSGFSSSSTAEEVTLGIHGHALTAIVTGHILLCFFHFQQHNLRICLCSLFSSLSLPTIIIVIAVFGTRIWSTQPPFMLILFLNTSLHCLLHAHSTNPVLVHLLISYIYLQ